MIFYYLISRSITGNPHKRRCDGSPSRRNPREPYVEKHITCEISNVIYLISSKKCHKHYVGETSRAIRKQIYEHKASLQKDGIITPVSRHFESEGITTHT